MSFAIINLRRSCDWVYILLLFIICFCSIQLSVWQKKVIVFWKHNFESMFILSYFCIFLTECVITCTKYTKCKNKIKEMSKMFNIQRNILFCLENHKIGRELYILVTYIIHIIIFFLVFCFVIYLTFYLQYCTSYCF